MMMLADLYTYAAHLQRVPFADELAYEHRQFHYDIPAIFNLSLRFLPYQRQVRQLLRDGTLTPHYDPRNNEQQFL